MKVRHGLWILFTVSVTLLGFTEWVRAPQSLSAGFPIQDGPGQGGKLRDAFASTRVVYPPEQVALLAFKQEKLMEVWAHDTGRWTYIKSMPILAVSGTSGPKLAEGDCQAPEGMYRIEYLNPRSAYHLSMKLNYPNATDRARAKADHRSRLGGDIFIHGSNVSIGCLAMGDNGIDELYALARSVGVRNVRVIIAPNDLRSKPPPTVRGPGWIPGLYAEIRARLHEYQRNTANSAARALRYPFGNTFGSGYLHGYSGNFIMRHNQTYI